MSFSEVEYARKKKQTRRDRFLAEMEGAVPWVRLMAVIEPYYPKSGRRGRPPLGLERMPRMYFVRQWHGLADEAVEDTIHDSQALRRFRGIDLAVESVPDATTLENFRHLLERRELTRAMLAEVNATPRERGLPTSKGTLIDATLIAAPPSTKNRDRERDPDAHQAKKGNQWYFGFKARIGADDQTGLVHAVVTTAANVGDVSQAAALLTGEEIRVGADAGYVGIEKRPEMQAHLTPLPRIVVFHVARRRAPIRKMLDGWRKDLVLAAEKLKASIRAKVEHPFHVVKNIFEHGKARYRGLSKNHAQLTMLLALSNVCLARGRLCPWHPK